MLTAEQLNAGLEDELMRQRLLNRAVHGYGVVVGFGLVSATTAYSISSEDASS